MGIHAKFNRGELMRHLRNMRSEKVRAAVTLPPWPSSCLTAVRTGVHAAAVPQWKDYVPACAKEAAFEDMQDDQRFFYETVEVRRA